MNDQPNTWPTLPADNPLASDRRLLGRHRLRNGPQFTFLAPPSSGTHTCALHDVSVAGIGLIAPVAVEPGTILALNLTQAQTGLRGAFPARVQHLQRCPDGSWLLGCSLFRRLTDQEICLLLQADSRETEAPS